LFDFEKLEVYQKAKGVNKEVSALLLDVNLERTPKDQFKRASLSLALNLAEGTSRFSKADRKNFCVIARGSLIQCVAILGIL